MPGLSPEEYAGIYEPAYQTGYHADADFTNAAELVVKLAPQLTKLMSVLDLGAAKGATLALWHELGVARAVGIDIAPSAVEAAQSLGRDVRLGSITALPFGSEAFDLVMSSDVLEHLHQDDVDRVICESLRVARRWVVHKVCPVEARDLSAFGHVDFNPHLTVQPIAWWEARFRALGAQRVRCVAREAFLMEPRKPTS